MSSMTRSEFYKLFRYRWVVQILAAMSDTSSCRFVTLLNKLDISRSMLSSTIRHMVDCDLITKNSGHGHPLRPEYLITERGKYFAPFCDAFIQSLDEHDAIRLSQSKWAVPILTCLNESDLNFSGLEKELSPITPRALSVELKLLCEEGYVIRQVTDSYPPKTLYIVGNSAQFLSELIMKNIGELG